ncbi:hypothetical protein HPB47_013958 [Ixodes persulcatus]|uniref:Uncharacterized protein n=1 Tax=Ixodes persulcatus TaxID=34615 RepID=A0AC60QZR9_IXOPE|nr:hypothetical protein HPB47_013958 [Ixodes persulcatus]
MVVKENAQSIWSQAGLAARSVKGVLAPQKKRGSGELPKPALIPEKVDLVKATLSYWGAEKVNVAVLAANLTNVLAERIQDSIKVERRLLNQQD